MRDSYVEAYSRLERTHWWWAFRRRIVLEELDRLLKGNGSRRRVLDVGCGAGMNLRALAQRYDCRGLEPDPRLAAAARENSGVPIRQGGLLDGSVGGEAGFDAVLLLDVIEHIDDDRGALRAAASMARPGGWIVINVPAMRWLWSVHDEVNEHRRRYEREDLSRAVGDSGLELVSIRYWGVSLAPAAWLARRGRPDPAGPGYEVSIPPRWVGRLMEAALMLEWRTLSFIGAPFGLSLLAVARKPAAG